MHGCGTGYYDSQQIGKLYKKQYTSALASRQVSVLALYLLMKLERIVRGMLDDDHSVKILLIV